MEFALDFVVAIVSFAIVGYFIVGGTGHFKSKKMPVGAMLISAMVIVTTAVLLTFTFTLAQPAWAQFVGLVIELAAAALFYTALTASRQAGLRYAFDAEGPDSLLTRGPYRYVRHPFYTSYVLFTAGWAIACWSWWALLNFAILTAVYIIAARVEERKFASGPLAADYAAYRKTAGLFWPRVI